MVDETRSPDGEPRTGTSNADPNLERELARTRRRNRTLIEAMPDAVLWLRRDGSCEGAASGRQSDLPAPPAQLVGHRIQEALDPSIAAPLLDAVVAALDTGDTRSVTLGRGERALVAYVTPVDADLAVAFLRGQRQVERIRAQLRRAERLASVGMLAAGAAHEINNPLSYLSLNLEVALEEAAPREDERAPALRERLESIRGALADALDGARRVRDIVSQLKSFSSERDPDVGAMRLAPVLESACRMVDNQIRHRAVFLTEIGRLPRVHGNPSRLEQAFVNLLVNAAQAIPEDGGSHVVRLAARVEGARVLVSVSDTGKGIDPAHVERVFDPFFTTKPVGEGTGLGLALAHEAVTACGGQIRVESTPGRGTTFTVELVTAGSASTPWPPSASEPASRPRVLVIDDEPLLGRSLARVLEQEYDVVVLEDGREAVSRIRAGERFDVIFCDVMMPHLNGLEVHAALHAQRPELAERIVFISGGAFGGRLREAIEALPNPRLQKPLSVDEVRALVRARTE